MKRTIKSLVEYIGNCIEHDDNIFGYKGEIVLEVMMLSEAMAKGFVIGVVSTDCIYVQVCQNVIADGEIQAIEVLRKIKEYADQTGVSIMAYPDIEGLHKAGFASVVNCATLIYTPKILFHAN